MRKITTIENKDKILRGLEKVYQKLVENKRQANLELVIVKDNRIIKIKP